MPKLLLRTTIEALNYSADDWELYTSDPQAARAAAAMNCAVTLAVNNSHDESEARKHIDATFQYWENVGARDSEPLGHLEYILGKVYRSHDRT